MASNMSTTKPLTLIVATTSRLGIGRGGALPWPSLKGEMSYFARVTKYVSPTSLDREISNAVIMGRKTWESIPQRFRPLKGRINVVVSATLLAEQLGKIGKEGRIETAVLVVRSLDEAMSLLQGRKDVSRLFVIGGSSMYAAALQHPATQRVLLTKILRPAFECDTFFPIDIEKEEGWKRGTTEDLTNYTSEDFGVEGTVRRESDVEYEFCMFARGS